MTNNLSIKPEATMSYILFMLLSFLGLDPNKPETEVKVIDEHTFVIEGERYYVEEGLQGEYQGVYIKQDSFSAFYHS